MDKLNVAIVGPGWVAEEHIKAYISHPQCHVRAIVGVIPEDQPRAAAYIQAYDLAGCDICQDYDATLERDDIDIVSLCTINSLHFSQAKRALEAEKHVFVEKPLVLNAAQLRDITVLASKMEVHTFVGHVGRYYPAVTAAKRFIDRNLIGSPYFAEAHYYHEIASGWKSKQQTAGSSLLMAGVHAVDIAWWLIGKKMPDEVFAYSQASVRREDFDYDPTLTAMIRFHDGSMGQVTSCLDCDMPYVFHLQVLGTTGAVRSNGLYSSQLCPEAKKFMPIPAVYPDDWDVAHHPFPEEIQNFVDGILTNEKRDLCIEEVSPVYELVFAAERSARSGKPVRLRDV